MCLFLDASALDAANDASSSGHSRRAFLGSALAVAAGGATLLGRADLALGQAAPPAAPATGDRVVFLGTNGGPQLNPRRSHPSLTLVVDGEQYMVDCGAGCGRQMTFANLPFATLHNVFITHHHSDHVAGLAEPLLLPWGQGPPAQATRRTTVWGPPPIERMLASFLELYEVTIDAFVAQVNLIPLGRLVRARRVSLPRTGIRRVMEDAHVRVSATRVQHGPEIKDAYAYRFDLKRSGKAVVFSGDTVPSKNLVALARDADLLVHEAMLVSALDQVLSQVPPASRAALRRHAFNSHTPVSELPRIAKEAGAKRLAMSHYGPGGVPSEAFLTEARRAAAGVGYGGEILAPDDLGVIAL